MIITGFIEVAAHHKPMIEKQTPPPTPTIDPGPHATLMKVKIYDTATNAMASATVCINDGDQEPDDDPYHKYSLRRSANRHKGPIRFRPLNYYFYTNGYFEVWIPPGKVSMVVRKGYAYLPEILHLEVLPNDTIEVEMKMKKGVDMSSLGWYSGDTHIHMNRTGTNDDTLLTLTSAKNIHYAYLLSMNTKGYDKGSQYESWHQKKGLGDFSIAHKEDYFISSGQEYRTSSLGHVTIIMSDKYVPGIGKTDNVENGPSLSLIAEQTHRSNGFIGLAHGGYFHKEADGLLLADNMDFLELLQFGGYRSLGLDGWYDFLNIGIRLPIVGACDYPYTRELGSEITYAWCDTIPTPRSFANLLAEGKSFATSGPMLFLEVDSKKPGEIFTFPEKSEIRLTVSLKVESPNYPVRYLELIVNGRVVEREQFPALQNNCEYKYNLKVSKSSWIAARTYAEAGTDAHTNPVYVYLKDQLPFDRDSARNIISRLDGSIETIRNKQVINKLQRLKIELFKMIEGKKFILSLPSIPVK
jgi:hypothetical protein